MGEARTAIPVAVSAGIQGWHIPENLAAEQLKQTPEFSVARESSRRVRKVLKMWEGWALMVWGLRERLGVAGGVWRRCLRNTSLENVDKV